MYYVIAAVVSIGVAAFQWLFWFSIVGHDTLWPLVVRWAAAVCFGLWAGVIRESPAPWWKHFLGYEAPQLLLINLWAVVGLFANPSDQANAPFVLAVFGLSFGDLCAWTAGWAGSRWQSSRRSSNKKPAEASSAGRS